ncbi:aspartate carbamoyltransferase [Vulcanimicrobium alpinum]|uniref:Aspartate carbamoyltransferase n=1 Tax=Vulcanimicrobium alpinum TaxID=3016050 RepID=A0AAN2CAD9_UNVUL|nr:aspartate carbamoyltransferase catalytic subunit [Vulcanimicrobium alpinum]BDE06567.1 aspartate carbamoyltransferase [Vulcanimicrobium alpinum]
MAPRSLLDVDDLAPAELVGVLDRAVAFRDALPSRSLLAGVPVLNLFFEASTRTATSFTLAEQRVGADVISFAPGASSLGKGETIADTALTLHGIGVRVIVVRHHESGFARRLADAFDGHVVNAGDGTHAHPTQALLDLMTLRQEFGRFAGLRVAIVGDILHSRVARSNIVGMTMLGIDVTLVGPATLLPDAFASHGVRIERDLDALLPSLDAVMMLRIQRERISGGLLPSLDDYTQRYQLNRARLRSLRNDAVILHPGPYNRGVELTDDVLDDPRSRYVAQVHNGVFVRMAVLDLLVNGAAVAA